MPNAITVVDQTTDGLKNLIANHRKRAATGAPLYLDALKEFEVRTGRGLEFGKSLAVLRDAAREDRLLTYRQLADASGAVWAKVRDEVDGHLQRLAEYAHRRGWPLIGAIVVNVPGVKKGRVEPDSLPGFLAAARALGYEVDDEAAFLKEQQALVFAWGKSAEAADA